MPAALLALIPSALKLIEGIVGKSESDKTAEEIAKQKLTMPEEMNRAESIAQELAASGMPGYETYKTQIDQLLPKTAQAYKEVASSPSSLIDMMSNALAETDKQYNQLAVENANYHLGNTKAYQNFLAEKAGMNLGIQGANTVTAKEAIAQKAQGTKDLLQSVEGAGAAGLNTYAMLQKLNYEGDYMDYMGQYFKNGGKGTVSEPQVATPPSSSNLWSTPSAVGGFMNNDTAPKDDPYADIMKLIFKGL